MIGRMEQKNILGICIAGKNQIAVRGLEILLAKVSRERIIVVPNRDDLGLSGWQPSLKEIARREKIVVKELEELYALENLLFLSLEFDQILKPKRFKSNNLVNMHFSLLPKYRGVYTSAWPILNGESESGVTLHQIDEGIDTGPIIFQKSFPLKENFTARDLYLKYMETGEHLLRENIDALMQGDFTSVKQNQEQATYYDRSSIDYSDLRLNLDCSGEGILKQVRAFHFEEYQIPKIQGYKVKPGRLGNQRSKHTAGTISVRDNELVVSSRDYDVHFEFWELD